MRPIFTKWPFIWPIKTLFYAATKWVHLLTLLTYVAIFLWFSPKFCVTGWQVTNCRYSRTYGIIIFSFWPLILYICILTPCIFYIYILTPYSFIFSCQKVFEFWPFNFLIFTKMPQTLYVLEDIKLNLVQNFQKHLKWTQCKEQVLLKNWNQLTWTHVYDVNYVKQSCN